MYFIFNTKSPPGHSLILSCCKETTADMLTAHLQSTLLKPPTRWKTKKEISAEEEAKPTVTIFGLIY